MDTSILNLKYSSEFTITGRGQVLGVCLSDNGYKHVVKKDLRNMFMGKWIDYKGGVYKVIGIETYAVSEDFEVDQIGLMIILAEKPF